MFHASFQPRPVRSALATLMLTAVVLATLTGCGTGYPHRQAPFVNHHPAAAASVAPIDWRAGAN